MRAFPHNCGKTINVAKLEVERYARNKMEVDVSTHESEEH